VTELVISRSAEEELRDIWRYIAAENPDAADRILLKIDEKFQILREFPDIGAQRDDIRPGARVFIEGVYLILYEHRPDEDLVEVVTVVDGRRDLSAIA
jgi:toxin ParE1/3/4